MSSYDLDSVLATEVVFLLYFFCISTMCSTMKSCSVNTTAVYSYDKTKLS